MTKLTTVLLILVAFPAAAQQLSPLQQYLYNESGYAPPMAPAQVPPPPTVTAAAPQVYYYPAPVPQVPVDNTVQDNSRSYGRPGYYEEEAADVGFDTERENGGLRSLLTSSGL